MLSVISGVKSFVKMSPGNLFGWICGHPVHVGAIRLGRYTLCVCVYAQEHLCGEKKA